jgi:hypothetical protein
MTVRRRGLTKALPSRAGSAGKSGHTLGTRCGIQGMTDRFGVDIRGRGFQIGCDVLWRFQVIGGVQGTVLASVTTSACRTKIAQ